ncbi:PREDICTED: serine carboxypeptidase-like 45 isoform X2 [Ipomoea nil]|uniref:serine carboxypeptidase-like 45 isoform X2 n=1 Tax=Ipomoea nil TaxID=35883 RepID=UPI0009009626|nr:PREDICTED: serine carboxypeptidase-like 45 isoform X2 [Ipomoea nil]
MVLWFFIFSCLLCSSLFFCSILRAELITSLPGQPPNITFKQYSGYIVTDAHHGRALFYYFVEAEAQNPLSLPLTLWLNGGPGCSSLGYGAFMEHGPFQPGRDGNLIKNKYSWNLESNMLYVESPIGVGFSYSNTSSDYFNWNDTKTAQDNLRFVLEWFKKFPQYRNSDLYLTGESYAGHYIPQLADLMLKYNKKKNIRAFKLKAIALGNPLLDIDISIDAAEFLWSHGAISDDLLAMKRSICNDTRAILENIQGNMSNECILVNGATGEEVGSDIDSSDLLLPICLSSNAKQQMVFFRNNLVTTLTKIDKRVAAGDPCLTDRIYAYLQRPEVQKALHANTTYLPWTWDFCSGTLQYQMQNIASNIMPTLSEILKHHIPILLFSGDQDTKIPVTQTRTIANMLARELKLIAFERHGPWYDGVQIAGWSQSFGGSILGKNVSFLTFASVRGAAHEVPFTSPSQALTLFRAFLKGYPPPRTS